MAKLFTIIIPLYNKCSTVQRAVYSVLRQDFGDFEILVVDDGSTDGGVENVRIIADSRIRLLCQENQGVSTARNRGVDLAAYPYIAFLDADDEWLPHHLSTLRDLIQDFPAANFYGTAYRYIYGDGRSKVTNGFDALPRWRGNVDFIGWGNEDFDFPLHMSAVAVERDFFQDLGGFRVDCKYSEDWELFARAQLHTAIAYDSRLTSFYFRETPGNTVLTRGPGYKYPGYFICPPGDMLLAALENGSVPDDLILSAHRFLDRYLLHRARYHLDRGERKLARPFLAKVDGRHDRRRTWLCRALAWCPQPVLAGFLRARKRLGGGSFLSG